VNPALVSRRLRCKVCRVVAAIEDVNARIVDDRGERRYAYVKKVLDYLDTIGQQSIGSKAVVTHAAHVMADMKSDHPMILPGQVVEVSPISAPASWFDVHDAAMGLGMDAMRDLAARAENGDLSARDLIALAGMGVAAAGKRADLEARGREHSTTMLALRSIASGHGPREEE
jgi:hypothetical protein